MTIANIVLHYVDDVWRWSCTENAAERSGPVMAMPCETNVRAIARGLPRPIQAAIRAGQRCAVPCDHADIVLDATTGDYVRVPWAGTEVQR